VGAFRARQGRDRRGRIEQQLDEATLILNREAEEVSLFNRPLRGLPGGSDDEVADTPALDLGGAFHDSERVRGNACLNAGGAVGFLGHLSFSLSILTVRHCHVQVKRSRGILIDWS